MRRILLGLGALALTLAQVQSAEGAAKPISPKVGSCYLLGAQEVQAPTSAKQALNCSLIHNIETYRISTAAFKNDPNKLSPIELSIQVAPICEPGVSSSKFINGWSYKIPSKSDWKSGARWLRCDAFVTQIESETATYATWKGKKLDFK